jgi:hypothetical protein
MSNTIAHRPHVQHHVPLTPVLAVIVTVALAAVVIWAVNTPQTPSIATSGTAAVSAPFVQAATVPAPDSPVFRHAQMLALQNGGYSQAFLSGRLHQVEGTMLDPLTTTPSTRHARSEFGEFQSVR